MMQDPGNTAVSRSSYKTGLRPLLPVLLLASISFAVYFNALDNGFVYDDIEQVVQNTWIRDARNIPKLFVTSVWAFSGAKGGSYYRPVMHLVYMADYHLFGLKPWGYHLTNILLHAGATVLVYFLSARLLAGAGEERSYYPAPGPVAAAAVFAVHPIHTEAVTWVAGLPEVSFSFFYLASLLMYIRSRDSGGKGFWASVVLFFVSCLCKESALTLPFLIVCYDYAYPRSGWKPAFYIKRYAPYFLVVCVYLAARLKVLGGFAPNYWYAGLSTYERVINVLSLFGVYMLKLVLPFKLNVYHVFHPIRSLWGNWGVFSLAFSICFCLALVAAARKDRRIFLCMAAIGVPLLPAIYVAGVGDKIIAERYLYLPSVGFAMLAGISLGWLIKVRAHARAAVAALVLILFSYSAGTVSRNVVWRDGYSLWSDTVAKSPDAFWPHISLGWEYLSRGRVDDALEQLQTSLKLAPLESAPHCNLGVIYYYKGQVDKAIGEFRKAISIDPDLVRAHYNLGRAYYTKGWTDRAIEEYKKAVRINPNHLNAHIGLAEAYLDKGWLDKAVEERLAAVRIDPADAEAHFMLGQAYKAKGALDDAVAEYLKAVELGPSAAVYNNLGNAYAAKGLMDSAIAQYEKALELDPDYETARHNIGLARKIKDSDTSPRGMKYNDPDTPRRED